MTFVRIVTMTVFKNIHNLYKVSNYREMSLKKENFVLGKYGLKVEVSAINIESLKISLLSNLAVYY